MPISQGHFVTICKEILRYFLIKRRAFFSNLSYNITTYISYNIITYISIESLACQIQN